MNINLLNFDSLDSTNTEALKQARLGAEEGVCIVARQQTSGRGRHGRPWVSEKDAGLYFSIVLRPRFDTQYLPLITLMTGVAVHDTLAEFGIAADIKWVNDLHVSGKKICGILAETTDTPNGLAVIVGIGINIKSSNFPPEIADTATSMQEQRQMSVPPAVAGGSTRPPDQGEISNRESNFPPYEGGVAVASADGVVLPSSLVESLTKSITQFYSILRSDNGPATIIEEWCKRSTYFSGKPVRVVLENESLEGITDGLEPNGALRVKRNDGSITIVQAGDVEQLRAASRMRQGTLHTSEYLGPFKSSLVGAAISFVCLIFWLGLVTPIYRDTFVSAESFVLPAVVASMIGTIVGASVSRFEFGCVRSVALASSLVPASEFFFVSFMLLWSSPHGSAFVNHWADVFEHPLLYLTPLVVLFLPGVMVAGALIPWAIRRISSRNSERLP